MGGGEGNTENGIPPFSFGTDNGEIGNDPPAGFRLAQTSNDPCDYYVRNGDDEAWRNACLKRQFIIHHVIYFAVPFRFLYATITAMFCTGQFFLQYYSRGGCTTGGNEYGTERLQKNSRILQCFGVS